MVESSKKNPFMLVISSYTMPRMKGDAILKKTREICPDSLRILLADAAYIETMISAINTASIHSCITLPFEDQDLVNQVESGRKQFLASQKTETLRQTIQRQNRQLFQIANNFKKKETQDLAQMKERKKKIRILESKLKAGQGKGLQEHIPSLGQILEDQGCDHSPQGFARAFVQMTDQIKDIFQTALFSYSLEPLTQSYNQAVFRATQEKQHIGIVSTLMPALRMLIHQSQEAGVTLFGIDFKRLMDRHFSLTFSQDRARAFLRVKETCSNLLCLPCIKYYLSWYRVVYGVIPDSEIETWLTTANKHNSPLTVAHGLDPVHPVNGEIKYHFPTDFLHAGKVNEDGSINFHDRGEIPFVKSGAFLAVKIMAEPGKSGIDVTGARIPVLEPQDHSFEAGPGTTLSEDGRKIYAAVDGQPHLDAMGKVTVNPELKIQGDLGFETGDVVFDGNVVVEGAVKEGFRVKGASLTAKEIHGAQIDLTGDLNVSFGIMDTDLVNVKGSVQAKFVHNCKINAFGDLIIQKEIIDSVIRLSGECINTGGTIINSEISANMGIDAGTIGSDSAKPSKLTVGQDEHTQRLVADLTANIRKNVEAAAAIHLDITALSEEDQTLHGEITQYATIQDRAQLELKGSAKKMNDLKASGNMAAFQKIKKAVAQLEIDAKNAEKTINKGFERQDAIAREIAQKQKRIEELTQINHGLEDEKKRLLEYTATKEPRAQVRVAKKILSGSIVVGPNTNLTLYRDDARCRIIETGHKSEDTGGLPFYEMKITGY
jgi:uncharacterized protein (DUF342 family)